MRGMQNVPVVLQSNPSPYNIDTTIGPIVIGVGLNLILYGVTLVQALQFYLDSKRDPNWLKSFVGFLFIADTLNSAFDFAMLYYVMKGAYSIIALHGANVPDVGTYWVGIADLSITAIVSGAVQLLFAWRIFRLTSNRIITAIIVSLALLQTLAGNAAAIAVSKTISNHEAARKVGVTTQIWLSLALVTDIFITVTLVLHLRQCKTGRVMTDDTISRAIRFFVQTGAITTIWVLVNLIVFSTMDNYINTIFNFPLCKIYTNCLLSSLNARSRWKAAEDRKMNASISKPWSKSHPAAHQSAEPVMRPHCETVISEIVFASTSEAHQLGTVSRTADYQFELESTISRDDAKRSCDITRIHSRVDEDWKEAV